jgi:hypothetical protein
MLRSFDWAQDPARTGHRPSIPLTLSLSTGSPVPAALAQAGQACRRVVCTTVIFTPNIYITYSYCKAIRMGINPRPSANGRNALPMTAPKALCGFEAFLA